MVTARDHRTSSTIRKSSGTETRWLHVLIRLRTCFHAIAQSTLIIEILPYEDFRKLYDTKYLIVSDSRKARAAYHSYKRYRKKLLKGFVAKKVYLNKGTYDTFDVDKFRYVLKSTARFREFTEDLAHSYGARWAIVEYIYDRRDGVVYCEFTNPMPYDERGK
jgi:hypothetical protein